VTAQEKIGSGIETARANQLMLIEKFSEEAKQVIRLKYKQAIPSAIKKKYGVKASYNIEEVEALLMEYDKDIESDLKKIDDKCLLLTGNTNRFFNDLGSINTLNLELLKSRIELDEKYRAVFDRIKDSINTKLP
jgi:predicted transcriptional regulator